MSHHSEEQIVCPNCGYHTTLNYCAQCGQETHLHKETFWGMVMHFVGHYFHVDSKFFKTIKTLVTEPGALTLAYWKQQRARYFNPISLYIFISTVYFIVSVLTLEPSIKRAEEFMTSDNVRSLTSMLDASSGGTARTASKAEIIQQLHIMLPALQKASHQLPKVFFFLVPFLAILLKLIFLKRKDLFFADHAVYSLHFHALGFMVFALQAIANALFFSVAISLVSMLIFFLYSVFSIRNVYSVTTGKAVAISLFTGAVYMVIYSMATVALLQYYMGGALLHN